ncbi:hypothetical protein ACHAWU_003220 [Discostella pseudostelligera]|uniref:Uncharacterized protein n=1 Tax=Discostella pseudostelligera TaxID=259834 RepID=A0ABD3N4C5_9STRA
MNDNRDHNLGACAQFLDEEILDRLENNDPGVEYLSYDDEHCQSQDWILGTGSAIGHSNVLRMLKIWWHDSLPWLDDFCLGLQHNRSIECLILRVNVSILPSSKPDMFQLIAPFFEHNRKLRCIDIDIDTSRSRNDRLKSSVFGSLMSDLRKCRNDQLHSVRMGCCCFTDREIAALVYSLADWQKNLLELFLYNKFGRLGSTALAHILISPEAKIQTLELRFHQLDDFGATLLGAALAINNTLKKLTLGGYGDEYIQLAGWRRFSHCLRNPISALEELYIADCLYDSQCMREIVSALAHNQCLQVLDISWYARFDVEWEWKYLNGVLCDVTSIESTYSSNHALRRVRIANKCPCNDDGAFHYLEMNASKNKAGVARQKILMHHFTGGESDIHTFSSMLETEMPHAISWIGRDYLGYSLMFDFVCSNPALFDISYNGSQVHAGMKRKMC